MTPEDKDAVDETIEDELELRGDDDEEFGPDESEERIAEAGMSDGAFVFVPAEGVEFEDDFSGVAK